MPSSGSKPINSVCLNVELRVAHSLLVVRRVRQRNGISSMGPSQGHFTLSHCCVQAACVLTLRLDFIHRLPPCFISVSLEVFPPSILTGIRILHMLNMSWATSPTVLKPLFSSSWNLISFLTRLHLWIHCLSLTQLCAQNVRHLLCHSFCPFWINCGVFGMSPWASLGWEIPSPASPLPSGIESEVCANGLRAEGFLRSVEKEDSWSSAWRLEMYTVNNWLTESLCACKGLERCGSGSLSAWLDRDFFLFHWRVIFTYSERAPLGRRGSCRCCFLPNFQSWVVTCWRMPKVASWLVVVFCHALKPKLFNRLKD